MKCNVVLLAFLSAAAPAMWAAEIHVSPAGDDAHPATADKPLATIAAAQRTARLKAAREPVTVLLHTGTYYLPETIRFTPEDSGIASAPMIYAAAPGEHPVLSGGVRLHVQWTPLGNGIVQAKTPPGMAIDQLFINGQRQNMARYPDYDAAARQFNGSAEDAIAPERVARWRDPAGGYIHAMHAALWGDMHWRILGKKSDGSLDYEGGWQNNRPSPMHQQYRFVENILEELDAPGEWFHDIKNGALYLFPPAGADLKIASIEAVRLRHLVEFNGAKDNPVRFLSLRGLIFRHAARTFMENREPLLRSDWTTYRGGAVMITGAEDAAIEDCDFDQVGGNAVFVSKYNRRVIVRGCLIRESGANGVAFVGDPKAVRSALFNYGEQVKYEKLDRTPGPMGYNFPADCTVEDCLITRTGRFEKQTAPIQISMARDITVRHCSIYDVPRAGINISDGCWGGHLIEGCDVFDTVLETGDHGSFNAWGRDRFWHPDARLVDKQVAIDPKLPFLDMVKPTHLRHNRWRCDHGWDIDLDDGSTRYVISHNLLLNGGLKLREGYGRTAINNVIVNNSLHPHVWYENSDDVFTRNIVMGPYRPARMDIARWGREVDRNLFATTDADRTKFADRGCDPNSLAGDPLFIDPAHGDFRVKEGSPALKLGFENFPMDRFGVRSPRLRAMARKPEIPSPRSGAKDVATAAETGWRGATLRELMHYEFSAVGVAANAGGIFISQAPEGSSAFAAGLRKGDFIQRVNDTSTRTVREFLQALTSTPPGDKIKFTLVRNQQPATLEIQASMTLSASEETLPPLSGGKAPQTFDELWEGYDPCKEPLETELLKEWEEDGVMLRVVRFRIGVFKGRKAMLAGVYGFPKGAKKLPGLLQIHGGGQYADYKAPLTNAKRGYATLSIAWAGRISAPAYLVNPEIVSLFWAGKTDNPKYRVTTDWGALDAYHAPCRNPKNDFKNVAPKEWTLDAVDSPRNNPWFLCTLAARRALTFLERQPEVDPTRLGAYGHSMGGKLTVMTAGSDARIKAAAPSCGGISDRLTDNASYMAAIADNVYLRHIACPIVFLSPANDFHGRINDLGKALGEIQSKAWRVTCAAHHNHQDTEPFQAAGPLWFDQHLKETFIWPATPEAVLILKTESGVPSFSVRPDLSKKPLAVDIFYTQQGKESGDKDVRENTIARFWHHAPAKRGGDVWTADLPVMDTDRPLWAYANVLYPLNTPVMAAGYYYGTFTAETFNVSSVMRIASPDQLKTAAVKATDKPSLLIESFTGDWQKEWFTYELMGRWPRRTHRLYDPKWNAPSAAKLALDVRSEQRNKLVVGLDDSAAEVALHGGAEWQSVVLAPGDFKNAGRKALNDWIGIRELRLTDSEILVPSTGRKKDQPRRIGAPWNGSPPEFRNLRWEPCMGPETTKPESPTLNHE